MGGVEMIPREYGYVILAIVVYNIFNLWMAVQVGKARKEYNVPYPTMYAVESENENANLFNCIQRGHQNSVEMMPMFFVLMVLGGMKHPRISTGLGLLYVVGRYFYFSGYSTGDPENRFKLGEISFYSLLALIAINIWTGIDFILGIKARL